MEQKRPRGREKRVTEGGKGVRRRGGGLGSGPVGTGAPGGAASPPSGERGGQKRAGGRMPIILVLLAALLGGGGGLGALLGGQGGASSGTPQSALTESVGDFTSGFFGGNGAGVSSGWDRTANTGKLSASVASGARAKYTRLLGGGKDTVTIMVYMCGTDLESRGGMATSDIQEMLAASVGKNVNLLLYTGGCTGWKNNVMSSDVNQIYQVRDGKLACLVKDAGSVSMTKPGTLTGFIQWCAKNYPASRNALIFWDHGGGSLSGYGYDQKFPNTGSMSLAGIQEALDGAGMKFDFIGFDACLMATLETALLAADYADYLIASEETEPGVGWYYTNWLTELSKNTSLPTVEVGKRIVDDFVDVCAQKCRGQQTTLSVVDLGELEATVPKTLTAFSRETSRLIQDKKYQTVSSARNGAREFARSSGIDQVDLVHLADRMGAGEDLIQAVLGAVKYNRTSSNMTNAYGLSIYFPYKKASTVDAAVAAYEQIGMDSEYARCIQEFASLEVGGQAASGGGGSPLPALLGTLAQSAGGSVDAGDIAQLLGGLLSGGGRFAGLDEGNSGFLQALDAGSAAEYLAENRFDESLLVWTEGDGGVPRITLPQDQWDLVHGLELNMFYDDGEGYIDLGLDNVFEFDEDGALLGTSDRTWLAIDGQVVAYYHLDTVDDGERYTITGRVPALRNGERVDLILTFDDEEPYGRVSGVRTAYAQDETQTVAKALPGLEDGDVLEFLCDFYAYDGTYQDSYLLGDPLTVSGEPEISNVDVGEGAVRVTYRFTDLYNRQAWTPALEF